MNRPILISVALCALLTSTAGAQGRTWIVDAANGAGTNFTDLPAAEAAAAHGDVLLVRAGTYSPLVTSKGIAVLGVTGQTLVRSDLVSPSIQVTALPPGKTFTLRGITAVRQLPPLSGQVVGLSSCRGPIHVQEFDAPSLYGSYSTVTVFQCDLVTFTDCAPTSGVSFGIVGSVASFVRCRIQGVSAVSDPRAGAGYGAQDAIAATGGAQLFVAESSVTGGHGTSIWPHFGQYYPSKAAIRLDASALFVSAGNVAIVAGGNVPTTMPRSAIDGNGTADVDPSVPLTPFGGAPAIAPGIQATLAPVAGLTASGGVLGGTVQMDLRSQPNDPYVLAAGIATSPVSTTLGPLCLDLSSFLIVGSGAQGASGVTSWTLPLPANASLAGVGLVFQAASAGVAIRLTNPAVVVLR